MQTLLVLLLLGLLAGCANGAWIGTEEYEAKQYIVDRLEMKHARYTQQDVDRIYRNALFEAKERERKASAVRSKAMAEDWAWNGVPPPPTVYGMPPYSSDPSRPGYFDGALAPRPRLNCMQYGQLGQGGMLDCH
jgi:hypothetical protein